MSAFTAIQLIDFGEAMRDPKNVSINIRVSDAERRAFQKAAAREDQSLSDWFRRLGRKRLDELKAQRATNK